MASARELRVSSQADPVRADIHYQSHPPRLVAVAPLVDTRVAVGVVRACYNVPRSVVSAQLRARLILRPSEKRRGTANRPPLEYDISTPLSVAGEPWLAVPRYFGFAAFGEPVRSLSEDGGAAPRLVFDGTLFKYQATAVDTLYRTMSDSTTRMHGAMLEAGCGTGKTVMAIALACRVARKTAIVVHKGFLLEQWRERIGQFAPTARVGVFRSGAGPDVSQTDVGIFTVQSVCRDTFHRDIFKRWGLLIVDECHHMCARQFGTLFSKFPADRRLGLTATADRADGLGFALHWYLGPTVFTVTRATAGVRVCCLRYQHGDTRPIFRRGEVDYTALVTRQLSDPVRLALLVRVIQHLVASGRRVIVMSARRNHLSDIFAAMGDDAHTSLYVGETSKKKKARRDALAQTSTCLLSTYSMGEEGLDLPALDTLVLASPKSSASSLRQSIGRIVRTHPGKQSPLVIDFHDSYSVFLGSASARRRLYTKFGYNTRDVAPEVFLSANVAR